MWRYIMYGPVGNVNDVGPHSTNVNEIIEVILDTGGAESEIETWIKVITMKMKIN